MTQTTLKSQQAFQSNGWEMLPGTFTYASATTINSSLDLTGVLQKGDKLMLNNTTTKYFYVVSLTSSVITVTGGSDYTVANAAITLPFFSKAANPQGFPQYFNFTPTWTTLTVGSGGVNTGTFSVIGKNVFFNTYFKLGTSPSMSATLVLTLPIGQKSYSELTALGKGIILDAGSAYFEGTFMSNGEIYTDRADTAFIQYASFSSTSPMTWTTNDCLTLSGNYEMA